jgi:hypothetical protein
MNAWCSHNIQHCNLQPIHRHFHVYCQADSLTWSQPSTKGISPTPRHGHTMTTVGKFLYIFGGTDGKKSFNNLFVLDIGEAVNEDSLG